jgi:hypothetical protein
VKGVSELVHQFGRKQVDSNSRGAKRCGRQQQRFHAQHSGSVSTGG